MAPRCDRAVLELLVGRGQDATTHPVMHRTAPTAENCLVPYVAGAEAEKPGSYQELPLGRGSALFPALLASNLRIPSPPHPTSDPLLPRSPLWSPARGTLWPPSPLLRGLCAFHWGRAPLYPLPRQGLRGPVRQESARGLHEASETELPAALGAADPLIGRGCCFHGDPQQSLRPPLPAPPPQALFSGESSDRQVNKTGAA